MIAKFYTPPSAPNNELLLQFFRGEESKEMPNTLSDVINASDLKIENKHNYIQWIFPTKEPSRVRPNSPIIDDDFGNILKADDIAYSGYCRGCRRYLNYMDLDCNGLGEICVLSGKRPFWKLPAHNFLRMTRALTSLHQTGHINCSSCLFRTMMDLLEKNPGHNVPQRTIEYWLSTQK